MAVDPKQIEAMKSRRFKDPIQITGYNVRILKVQVSMDEPQTAQDFVVKNIEKVGDLATVFAEMRIGKFVPMPDISLQMFMVMIDTLGLLEPNEDS